MACPWRVGWIFGVELQQPGQHIGFFNGGAFPAQHIFAIAAKPFVYLGGVGKAFGVECRCQRGNGLARAGMACRCGGGIAVARGARPFAAMAAGEKHAAALGAHRLAGYIAPALHLQGSGGVGGVRRLQYKSQRQQRGHAGERSGVWGVHAAMVRGVHEEWLKERRGGVLAAEALVPRVCRTVFLSCSRAFARISSTLNQERGASSWILFSRFNRAWGNTPGFLAAHHAPSTGGFFCSRWW
jgi:hypothetical protein